MIFLDLFWTFLKIGALTFGGGYAMLPLIESEALAHGWMTSEEILNLVAVSESTPGPFAVNASTYIGMNVGGFLGALLATLGVVLPSFIIILIVASCFLKFKKSKTVAGLMSGLKPATVGLIGAALLSMLLTVFFPSGIHANVFSTPEFYLSLGIFGLGLVLSFRKIQPVYVILLSAVLGIGFGFLFNLP